MGDDGLLHNARTMVPFRFIFEELGYMPSLPSDFG